MLDAGTRVGPYEVLSLIGAGGMVEVYRAHDPRVGRDVAINVSAEQLTERFSREIHAVAALNHPNIYPLYDVALNYLVMELIEGETLQERIKRAPDGSSMAVQITAGNTFKAGNPTPLFPSPIWTGQDFFHVSSWNVTSDGKQFLMPTPQLAPAPFTAVLNWTSPLEKSR